MNMLTAIQVLNALMDVAPKGVGLFQQITDLLKSSDEPTAKEALARLHATYDETAAAADTALNEALSTAPE